MDRKSISWQEASNPLLKTLCEQIYDISHKQNKKLSVYGIPRGGVFVAAMLQNFGIHLVESAVDANIFVDDIIDTGKTRDLYKKTYPDIPFIALVDKQKDERFKNCWVTFPWERMTNELLGPEDNIIRLLEYIGEDPDREGLKDTPARVLRSYKKLYGGYNQKPEDVATTFKDESWPADEMVLLRDIPFYSTCEHHMLPFYGKAHIAYIPKNNVLLGISKLARILEIYARRLQIQERIGVQVCDAITELIDPVGVACILEATHFCMTSRGVEKQSSILTTSALTGAFRDDGRARTELLSLIGK